MLPDTLNLDLILASKTEARFPVLSKQNYTSFHHLMIFSQINYILPRYRLMLKY